MSVYSGLIEVLVTDVARRAKALGRPIIVGVCGAQGSGKTTTAGAVVEALRALGMTAATASIDDFYLTKKERFALAERVHPLLSVRGVPGTHDVAIASKILDDFRLGAPLQIPTFDKAIDDRVDQDGWQHVHRGTEVLILEGWCVGAKPEPDQNLRQPVNELEKLRDQNAVWRTFANGQLATRYRGLFDRLDLLILLHAPAFGTVFRWREEQEESLRRERGLGMSSDEVRNFIAHYERITRHILAEMPSRADIIVYLDDDRKPVRIDRRSRKGPDQR